MRYDIRLKRVYDASNSEDGARLLVDRLWPRGKRREDLKLTEWRKELAPSSSLRREWHSGALQPTDFFSRYRQELLTTPDNLLPVMRAARVGPVSLLTASRDVEQSHLPILRAVITEALEKEDRQAEGADSASPVCYNKFTDL